MSESETWAAIDLMRGQVVSLRQGKPTDRTTWSKDPSAVAKRWELEGATGLHIVDLDATLSKGANDETIESIANNSNIPVQVGGGIRSLAAIRKRLESKIARVVIGTMAYSEPSKLAEALSMFGPERIVVAADYRTGTIVTNGWKKDENVGIIDAINRLEAAGVKNVLVTSVDVDGTALGPDLATLRDVCAATGMNVLASGGIRSAQDVLELQRIGVDGVVLGRAMYEGTIRLGELGLRA